VPRTFLSAVSQVFKLQALRDSDGLPTGKSATQQTGMSAARKAVNVRTRGSNWALLAVLLGAIGIGFAPIWVRLSETGPTATAFWRVTIALPLLWLRAKPVPQKPWLMISACGFLFAADLTLWHWSLKLTTVTNSTLLSNLAPLFVTLAAHWLFHEKITRLFMVGLFLGIAGMAVLVGRASNSAM